ncbi:MAG: hypothetical protein U0M66_06075 [Bacilli bacterium]|nr:hypothetical protein [Bacilli bacterium]
MNTYMKTKFEQEVGSVAPGSIKKTLLKKSFNQWYEEHLMRLQLACILMKEMGIKERIYEFYDADVINGKRIETFSDYLNDAKHNATIVSRNLESGNFDGTNVIKSKNGPFGELSEYVTERDVRLSLGLRKQKGDGKLSYDVIDSLIFDSYHKRIERYIGAALGLGKDCYFPIIGYIDSESLPKELNETEKIKSFASDLNNCVIDETTVITPSDNSFVKVIKIEKSVK